MTDEELREINSALALGDSFAPPLGTEIRFEFGDLRPWTIVSISEQRIAMSDGTFVDGYKLHLERRSFGRFGVGTLSRETATVPCPSEPFRVVSVRDGAPPFGLWERHVPARTRRFELYVRAREKTVSTIFAADEELWPGGKLTGFVLWNREILRTWARANGVPEREIRDWSPLLPHDEVDDWIDANDQISWAIAQNVAVGAG